MSEANAMLRTPVFAKMDAPRGHGGRKYKGRKTRELVWGNKDPVKRVTKYREAKFPLDEKALLPKDVLEAVRFFHITNRIQYFVLEWRSVRER